MDINHLKESVELVRGRLTGRTPSCAMVLGSGWGAVTDGLDKGDPIPYSEIPCLGQTSVEGHSGLLVPASLGSLQVLLFQGRRHWYEGVGWDPIVFPILLCVELGVKTLILTNAAGGISPDFSPGDLMVLDDHVNAMGGNPLTGSHDPVWGPRFPDQSEVYTVKLRDLLDQAAHQASIPVRHGVYVAVSGPTYETPAEIRAYRSLGGDAIGMSTVPEAMLANAAGLDVAGISCITNLAAGVSPTPLSHAEVIEQTRQVQPRMQALLQSFLQLLESASHGT